MTRLLVGFRPAPQHVGCDWGRLISLPGGDKLPCQDHAEQRTIIHHPDGGQLLVQLCTPHQDKLLLNTDPHWGQP